MKDYSKSFYKSAKWKKCRSAYISSRVMIDGGLCEECREVIGYIVHHKIQLTPENISNADTTLNFEHLEYVCKKCHDKFENHGLNKSNNNILFDENGQPFPADSPPNKDFNTNR